MGEPIDTLKAGGIFGEYLYLTPCVLCKDALNGCMTLFSEFGVYDSYRPIYYLLHGQASLPFIRNSYIILPLP